LSDDGRHGVTLIAFIGSVFSPFYTWARRRGAPDPLDHCAFNVALYGKPGRWALTERPRGAISRSADRLKIGPSAMSWNGSALVVDIDEVAVPLPGRLRGRVRLYPDTLNHHCFRLDEAARHRWQPIAPSARVEVALDRPRLHWSGAGYWDWNSGEEPLESAFAGWHWSRSRLKDGGGVAVLYDLTRHSGGPASLALHFDRDGNARQFSPPPAARLPATRWRLGRLTRADQGYAPAVIETLEDTPFYARSVLSSRLLGESVTAMHESLSLSRFAANWVQLLLPFRMRREGRVRDIGG
jgi:carotenoid 1,2-hydratase